ncbi:MAG: glycosyltransferase family 39 protein [Anaerolineales bacterium]|jgi:4-amino-4-deoxy-L-arabinose transferase-like glycosyltransferase
MNPSKENRVVFIILLAAFVLRGPLLIVAFQHPGRAYLPDSQSYIAPALKLLATGYYPVDSAMRTPVYPMFVAAIYGIGGQNPIIIILVQMVISTLSVFITYKLGSRLISKPAAMIGAVLIAISVESITNSFFLLTESLFTFLLLASLLAWVKSRQDGKGRWLVIAAILMGLAILCRPIAFYYPLVVAGTILFDLRRRWIPRLRDILIYLVITALVLFPWLLRDYILFGSPTVSTITNYNLLFYNAAQLEANLTGVSETAVLPNLQSQANQMLERNGWADTEGNRASVEGRLAWQIILAHPVRYVYLHLKSDLNNFLPDVTDLTEILGLTVGGKGTLGVLNQYGLLAAVQNYFGGNVWLLGVFFPLIALIGLTYLADIVGVVSIVRERKWFALAILLFPMVYLMLIPGAPSEPRFRVPAMPYFCLLAGLGMEIIFIRAHKKFSKKIA